MGRKRRNVCQVVPMRKLDRPVMLAAYTQDSLDWREWLGRRVSLRTALEMFADGDVQAVVRQTPNGLITIYRETKPARASRPSPTTLTMGTLLAVSGVIDWRAERDRFTMWPFEFDKRNAATVGPAVSERERLQAQQLLDRARGVRRKVEGKSARYQDVRTWHAPAEMPAAA